MTEPITDQPAIPAPPVALGAAGNALWTGVWGDFEELRPDERRMLLDAAASADLVDRIEAELREATLTVKGSAGQQVAHPLLAELRAARTLLSNLLRGLGLTDDGEEEPRLTPSEAGRRAAMARWQR